MRIYRRECGVAGTVIERSRKWRQRCFDSWEKAMGVNQNKKKRGKVRVETSAKNDDGKKQRGRVRKRSK